MLISLAIACFTGFVFGLFVNLFNEKKKNKKIATLRTKPQDNIYGLAYDINFNRLLEIGAISQDEYDRGRNHVIERRPKLLEDLIGRILTKQLYS